MAISCLCFCLACAIIVFGGTAGAVLVSFSIKDVASMPRLIKAAISSPPLTLHESLEEIVGYATTVKREGILSLEKLIGEPAFIQTYDPLLVRGLTLLMDGVDRQVIKEALDRELYIFEQVKKREISIFEAAGEFLPTMGIIGTVLGLIHVLSNMESQEELAKSIAVAFIATLYGVCFANLLYIPLANKLKLRLKQLRIEKEMIMEGLVAINDFESPMVVRERLIPHISFQQKEGKQEAVKIKHEAGQKRGSSQ
jgi:chemotaxis protein MotA